MPTKAPALHLRRGRNRDRRRNVKTGVDDEERQAPRAEGLNPDDPAVVSADMVRWELSCLLGE